MTFSPPVFPRADLDRRAFLAWATVLAAGSGCADRGATVTAQADAASSLPSQLPATPPPIPLEIIEHAERLAGITFTQPEREMMSRTLADQISTMSSRQKLGPIPNSLAPACVFDPRPAGFVTRPGPARVTRDAEEVPPIYSSEVDIAFAPLVWVSEWLRTRQVTSERLTRLCLDRLKRFDPQLKCVVTLMEQEAVDAARRADRDIAAGNYRGPLHGVPWGAKDLLDTRGTRTTWGAEPFVNRVPDSDARVVRMLRDAGAVLVAKLSLGALAYGDIWQGGRTNNPWKPEEGSSGSSAGSACAVAAGLLPFAIGTETYGSITSPCFTCGTTGLRPTFGRVSRAGAMALCWSLDKIGPICRRVTDTALVLAAINGQDPADPSSIEHRVEIDFSRGVRGLTAGYLPSLFGADAGLDRAALDAARACGLNLRAVEIPDWPYESLLPILTCEAAAAFEDLTRSNQDDMLTWQAPEAWPNTFRQSWFVPANEVIQADRFRSRVCSMMHTLMSDIDVLITPSLVGPTCLITNFTGHPALTLRTAITTERKPHAITVIGKLFDEASVCRVGAALERTFDVWHQRPPVGS